MGMEGVYINPSDQTTTSRSYHSSTPEEATNKCFDSFNILGVKEITIEICTGITARVDLARTK
jgi:hypothetical protein